MMPHDTNTPPPPFRTWEEFDAAYDEQQAERNAELDQPFEIECMRRFSEWLAFPGDR